MAIAWLAVLILAVATALPLSAAEAEPAPRKPATVAPAAYRYYDVFDNYGLYDLAGNTLTKSFPISGPSG